MNIKKKQSEYEDLLREEGDIVFSCSGKSNSKETLHLITKVLNKYRLQLFSVHENELPTVDSVEMDKLIEATADVRGGNRIRQNKMHLMRRIPVLKFILPIAAMFLIVTSFLLFNPKYKNLCLVDVMQENSLDSSIFRGNTERGIVKEKVYLHIKKELANHINAEKKITHVDYMVGNYPEEILKDVKYEYVILLTENINADIPQIKITLYNTREKICIGEEVITITEYNKKTIDKAIKKIIDIYERESL